MTPIIVANHTGVLRATRHRERQTCHSPPWFPAFLPERKRVTMKVQARAVAITKPRSGMSHS